MDGYAQQHPVGISVRADMLETVAGYSAGSMERELGFAVAALDFDDPASMRWLASLLARRIDEADDKQLAKALYDAELAGDTDAILEAENEICGRLAIPPDETEQGLTQVAADIIDGFLRAHGFTVRGEEATRA